MHTYRHAHTYALTYTLTLTHSLTHSLTSNRTQKLQQLLLAKYPHAQASWRALQSFAADKSGFAEKLVIARMVGREPLVT